MVRQDLLLLSPIPCFVCLWPWRWVRDLKADGQYPVSMCASASTQLNAAADGYALIVLVERLLLIKDFRAVNFLPIFQIEIN